MIHRFPAQVNEKNGFSYNPISFLYNLDLPETRGVFRDNARLCDRRAQGFLLLHIPCPGAAAGRGF
jgi:hypothetical protein